MDNFRVIYRILRYLEKALDYDEPDMNCISAKTMAISERRWLSLLAMLAGENYIEVVCARESVGRKTVTSVSSVRLTLRGLEYLQENPTMKRAEAIEKKAGFSAPRRPHRIPENGGRCRYTYLLTIKNIINILERWETTALFLCPNFPSQKTERR